ncbi:MAG: DM13 domain-containing protein, partial [Acidimicrobiales bacterium]
NIGDQNYEISADVDLSTFGTVQVWCKRFGVEFGSATLA